MIEELASFPNQIQLLTKELAKVYSKIKFLELEVIHFKLMPKWSVLPPRNLTKCLHIKSLFFDKSGLGYTVESSSSANVSKEMKFVKAKKPMVATPIVENVKVKEKPIVIAQKVLTKPQNPFVAKPKTKGKSLPKSQRGP